MILETVLLLITGLAAVTDLRWHKIYNWTTYPGILLGILLNAGLAISAGGSIWDGLQESLAGFFLCGFILLVCFVLFQVGGGDVKLLAMVGAFLGASRGLEVLLWTFVLGAVAGVAILIWRVGCWKLIKSTVRHVGYSLRLGSWLPLDEDERKQLQPPLYLAPAATLAVAIVIFHWAERLVP